MRHPRRLIGVALVFLLALVMSVGATAGSRDGDRAFGPSDYAQDDFTGTLAEVLQDQPDGVVDFYWLGNSGVVIVSESARSDVERYFEGQPVEVHTRSDVVPYVDRFKVENEVFQLIGDELPLSMSVAYQADIDRVLVKVAGDPEAVPRITELTRAGVVYEGRWIGVDVIEQPGGPYVQYSTAEGGEVDGECTGGIDANWGAGYGLNTAQHCASTPSSYDAESIAPTYIPPESPSGLRVAG